MALYMKQDFTPPVLSRRWLAVKFRPNMLVHSHENIVAILESGLMFREDSIEVEQCVPSAGEVWGAAGGCRGGWLTGGEAALGAAALSLCLTLLPPRSMSRWSLVQLALYASAPLALRGAHRRLSRGALAALLRAMRGYLAVARRAAACLKEAAALRTRLGSLSSVLESSRALLCRQQSELSVVMSRASSALLGNAPWLRDDVAWHAVERDDVDDDNLMKIHHAFLVVQSTLLKHIAMVHYTLPRKLHSVYRNHNERLHWIHSTLIAHLTEEFRNNFEALERMYRLLKNAGNREDNDCKKLGAAVRNNWIFSEVHSGVVRASLELKLALNKTNSLDMLLDSCAVNNQDIEIDILNKDVDDLIDNITKCLTTVQNSQLRLKKLKGKIADSVERREDDVVESPAFVMIEDKVPQTRDEVFYLLKTEDDVAPVTHRDVTTAPGKREIEATKVVLNELKRKLGKREDMMRERERQALVNTMPELKNIPEFPRQIQYDEYIVRKGYISKIKKENKKRLFRRYKIASNRSKRKKYGMLRKEYVDEHDIKDDLYEANALLNIKSRLLTIVSVNKDIFINRWCKVKAKMQLNSELSDLSELESASNNLNEAVNSQEIKIKFTKKDLELTESSSESDFEYYKNQRALLNDIRRHRVARRKNHPSKPRAIDNVDGTSRPRDNVDGTSRPTDNVDESLKPIEYSFGAGLAMASVLQVNNNKFLNIEHEEVFNGDGEVSNDSGNDEDA